MKQAAKPNQPANRRKQNPMRQNMQIPYLYGTALGAKDPGEFSYGANFGQRSLGNANPILRGFNERKENSTQGPAVHSVKDGGLGGKVIGSDGGNGKFYTKKDFMSNEVEIKLDKKTLDFAFNIDRQNSLADK